MNIKTFVIPVDHMDYVTLGHICNIKRVLASEFVSIPEGDRMCRLVCEVE